ncbi:enoyl-CoA hydratase/isomerase family protein [Williamsia muralis]|uniref:Enoyl-CoA hydratase/isomerase family protein n=1 Tax=Williamsia marianensis TaxID=85044 RepID=A0ABU4ETW9_WILMA|nr:enoyl-CoA hydratase/isomerase family protein [Williamsia muralis]MDV7134688.1 enoyl-CoA hydratase/isomerase family protein [Williamsia muralis]
MPYLDKDGEVSVLHFGGHESPDPQNRFNPDWLKTAHALLDEVEAEAGPRALVTTGHGKYYSTGADLSWGAQNPGQIDWCLSEIQALLARLLAFPMPTVAAMQGHAFGAGAFLAIAHDHTVMRADRGYLCFPGITLGAAYAPGVLALTAARLPARAGHEALTTGRRYGGEEALRLGLVDEVAEEADVLTAAVEWARFNANTRSEVLGDIKRGLHPEVFEALKRPVSGYNQ